MKTVLALLLAGALMAATQPAAALEVDFSTVLTDQDGKPYQECLKLDASKSPPFCEHLVNQTLARLVVQSLNKPDPTMGAKDLTTRGKLAIRLNAGGKQEVDTDDVRLIRDAIERNGITPVGMVRVLELLDPAALKK